MLARLSARMFGTETPTERIGRFELGRKLGAGAMGVVYAAWDPDLGRHVAIKLLHDRVRAQSGGDSNPEARLLREARAMAQLRHPNVVQVHEAGTHDSRVFVAMELIEGQSLRTWARARERSWAAIVDVFIAAGRGLAAAHAAGLIHRDFKPDNVLIEDGRVFVGDFGLARGQGGPVGEAPPRGHDDDTLIDSLTRSGAFVGTPAYMAPEAFTTREPDARADQYGFCASLFELLFGQLAFAQTDLDALVTAKRAGPPTIPAGAPNVPPWLRRLVLRGLAPAPEARFASMDALLEALDRGRRRGRRVRQWTAVAGVAALLLAGGTAAVWRGWRVTQPGSTPTPTPTPMCRDGAQRVERVWSRERREHIREAFEGSRWAFASSTFAQVETSVDRSTEAWVREYTDTCEATHVRGEQSARTLDLRMRCLERRLSELDAILDRLESPTYDDISRAATAVHKLTPASVCREVERLESTTPLPEDRATQALVADIRRGLDQVEAGMNTNNHALVASLAEELLERAEASDYKPVAAEAARALGIVWSRTGRPRDSARVLEQAIVDAQASGHDEVAAMAVIAAIHTVGFQLRDVEAGRRHQRQGRALLERLGDPPRLLANYTRNSGTLEVVAGELETARQYFERSLDLQREIDGPEHFSIAESLSNLAVVERRLGNEARALALYQAAREGIENSLGRHHPYLGTILNNIAVLHINADRDAEAEAVLREAVALAEQSLSPTHASAGHPYNNLGELLYRSGRYEESIALYDRAVGAWEASLGDDHPLLATALTGRGGTRHGLGDLDGARADLERALDIRAAAEISDWKTAQTEFFLARVLDAQDEGARAMVLAQRSHARLVEQVEADDDLRVQVEAWLAAH